MLKGFFFRQILLVLLLAFQLAIQVTYAEIITASDPLSICDIAAGNLIRNCGFETGDFSGWTRTGNADGSYVVSNFDGFAPNSGLQFAALGPSGSNGFLSQTVPTTPGNAYTISWYLASDGGTPNNFSATWNGSTIFSRTNIASPDFVRYSFAQVATATSSTLTFAFGDEPGYLALDDVAVTVVPSAVPEPNSAFLLTVGAAAVLSRGVWVLRRKRSRSNHPPAGV